MKLKYSRLWFGFIGSALLLCCPKPAALSAELSPGAVEFFESNIRPVLAQDCYECHRTNGKKKGGLALDSRQALLDGGDSGAAFVPGDPNASLLIKAIRHEDDLEMPKASAKLEATVIADFEKWIRMGAPDPRDAPASDAQIAADTDWDAVMNRRKSWWSFQPIKKSALTNLPPSKGSSHPVDRFLTAKLSEAQLTRADKADRKNLIRRLSYTLRGLPPSPEEIEKFVNDKGDRAYERLVDSYLASPRYGERWARHWMDWTRYADSHGSEGDPLIPYAWRYRDYLIRALNADVPYDQMVREHLAGDLLPSPRINRELGLNESALGIGHLRMVFHGFAPTDALDEQVRFTDDQIGTVSKAFQGLTVSCARCHNHKFDPISQKDYYGWYGIFVSAPPATVAVDAPNADEPKQRADLAKTKNKIKALLAEAWLKDAAALATKLATPDERLKKTMLSAKDTASALHPFFLLHQSGVATNSPESKLSAWWKTVGDGVAQTNRTFVKKWDLSADSDFASWRHDGPGVRTITKAGDISIVAGGESIVSGIYPAGVYSHLTSTKDRGVILSPKFKLDQKYDIWMRVAGDGGASARYVVQNYPRKGTVFPVTDLVGGQWKWVKHSLEYWEGDQIHVELATAADQPVLADVDTTRSWFGISSAVITRAGDLGPREVSSFAELFRYAENQTATNAVQLASVYAAAAKDAAKGWRDGNLTDEQALFLDQLLKAGLLRNQLSELASIKPLVAAYRKGEESIRVPTRAQGVIETEPVDQPLFVRGEHKHPSDLVPRRFLDAIDTTPYPKTESGRRQLAEDFLRADNPLTTRVIVNRVWHHLFGRGIVATPDNFGRMGQEPSHPELLDHLAGWFADHGYSIKKLIQYLVTTETWQLSSEASADALAKDPNNILLSHFNVRRLEAESIRDALLSVTGDLKTETMYGPPVGGKAPRRSVYLRVKRNDLDPFLSAFDAPAPASTVGKREVTNVPGQSLTLLNDPFVIELAEHWAEQIKRDPGLADTARRVEYMFERSLGRKPTAKETERAKDFLNVTESQRTPMIAERKQLEDSVQQMSKRFATLKSNATYRVYAQRKSSGIQPVTLPEPVASWDFKRNLKERGGLETKALGKAKVVKGSLLLDGKSSYLASAPLTKTIKAKTMEVSVQLADLKQQGGGVMTIQTLDGGIFDSIVFAEKQPQQWLAGSEVFHRTQHFEGAPETEATKAPVHLVMVYDEDGTITAYRNGKVYGKPYKSDGLVTFEAGKSQVLFGNRHGEPVGSRMLSGRIHKARIYGRALSAHEVEVLATGKSDAITDQNLVDAMTATERADYESLNKELAQAEERLKSAKQFAGLSSEWADLAHAMFNLKEFIFIR